jgi:surfactin synthase thioesterase subunit
MESINLFCLPFAGGNKYSYREYEKNATSGLNIIPLEYPGRGGRMKERFITDMNELVDHLFDEIRFAVSKRSYAIYGHSMGAVVAFFLVKKIIANGLPSPLHLFVSGTTGPSSHAERELKRHLLPKEEFIEEIRVLDGCPEDILQNAELLDFLEPILRADFELSETFDYTESNPLDIPITVITGTEEDMEADDIYSWQKESLMPVDFRTMPGKHFFIHKYPREIIGIISEKLSISF